MIAAARDRNNPRIDDFGVIIEQILMARLKAEPAAKRDISDIRDLQAGNWCPPQHMFERPDTLDRPHRPRPEACTRPVCDTKIHRHADQRHIKPFEMLRIGIRLIRRTKKRARLRKRPFPPLARKHRIRHTAKFRIKHIPARSILFLPEALQPLVVNHTPSPCKIMPDHA